MTGIFLRSLLAGCSLAAMAASPSQAQVAQTGTGTSSFSVSGSKTIGFGLLPALVEAYSYANDTRLVQTVGERGTTTLTITAADGSTATDIVLMMPGSTDGMADLLNGRADIAISARALREAENRAFSNAGFGHIDDPGVENILALDGLILVASKSNPVRALSMADAALVFAGQATNWAELGGPDAPIRIYAREFASGTIEAFNNLVMKPASLVLSAEAIIVDSDRAVSDAVADDPFGIGISSFSNIRNAGALAIRGVCGKLSPANAFTIKSEEYPLTRRLLFYTPKGRLDAQAQAFTDFVLSAEAQDIIAAQGFVDQAVSTASVNQQGLRFASSIVDENASISLADLREITAALIGAERLSLTFRFLDGGAGLDNKARADVDRLARMLADERFRGQEIMLVGFSDARGDAKRNRTLSVSRADQVRRALQRAAPGGTLAGTEFNVLGFGEVSPLRCNDTASGRSVNRRVEVWVRPLETRG